MFASKSLVQKTKSPIRNLMMLFFTIVFGFGSVMVMANLTVQTNIQNAIQTIMRVVITSDGTDGGTKLIEFNNTSGKIYISTGILHAQTSFSGNVLGLDANGELIYVASAGLTVSGAGGGNGDDLWTGAADKIRNINTGSVGIGATPATGKLYVTSNAETELALEDSDIDNAANIHLINNINTRMIGGFSDRFYIGNNGSAFLNILTGGNVGIGTINPKAVLQVSGTLIAGDYSNAISGGLSTSSIVGGYGNTITGRADHSVIIGGHNSRIRASYVSSTDHFIGGGVGNIIYTRGDYGANGIVGGLNNVIYYGGINFIGGGESNSITGDARYGFIGGGNMNVITRSYYSFIGGGVGNRITDSNEGFIGGGDNNAIQSGGRNSFIAGGDSNIIEGGQDAFVGGYKSYAYHNNTFVWNTDITSTGFASTTKQQFLINAPYAPDGVAGYKGGVGINVNDPKTEVDIKGLIRVRPRLNSNTTACAATIEGAIYYSSTSGHFYGCNATNQWVQLDN